MVELFYVRKVTAQYSLANFHDVLLLLLLFFKKKHIGPNYTFRDADRILINIIGLNSVLSMVASFWFREVLNIIIFLFVREESQCLQAQSRTHNLTGISPAQVWVLQKWSPSPNSVANGREADDSHTCPAEWRGCSFFPSQDLIFCCHCFAAVLESWKRPIFKYVKWICQICPLKNVTR